MPRGDRTGPWGRGPMTGRSAGYCAGFPDPGYMNPVGGGPGRGGGRGRGRGMGWRFRRGPDIPDPRVLRRYEPDPSYGPDYGGPQPEDEKPYLEDVLRNLETEIREVKARLKELSKEKGGK